MSCIQMDHHEGRAPPPFLEVRGMEDKLGPWPRETLSAFIAYGLDDAEIGRYHGLRPETVTHLRKLWGLWDGF